MTRNRRIAQSTLGQRIGGWALNLFASGLVLLAMLVFGRQVVQWWRAPQAVGLQEPRQLVDGARQALNNGWLQFGDSPLSVQRTELSAPEPVVLAQLRLRCRNAAQRPPTAGHLPGAAEQRLLDRVAGQKPIEREPGKWSMHELTEPMPMVAIVADGENGEPPRRVISWGLALPANESELDSESNGKPNAKSAPPHWCLFVCAEANLPSTGTVVPMLPQPSRAQRLLTLRAQDGVVVSGWNGHARPDQWVTDFDRWANLQDWQALDGWRQRGDTWHRRYSNHHEDQVDVQFSRSGELLRGFWMFIPADRQPNSSSSTAAGSNQP